MLFLIRVYLCNDVIQLFVAEQRDVNFCLLVDGPAVFVKRRRLSFGSSEWAILTASFDSVPTHFKWNVQPDT